MFLLSMCVVLIAFCPFLHCQIDAFCHLFNKAFMYVCMYAYWSNSDDNETATTSTPSVSCSPRWIVWPNTGAYGARWFRASTQQQCLNACVDNSSCVAVDWIDKHSECWIHNRNTEHYARTGVTQFKIAKRCNLTSSTLHHYLSWQNLLLRITVVYLLVLVNVIIHLICFFRARL